MLVTVGHGTLEFSELAELVAAAGVTCLVDVRSMPGSRRLPHFGRDEMAARLPAFGVAYDWRPALGGRRRPRTDSRNVAWRNRSFQAYADYMGTTPFREALDELTSEAASATVAIMCAESLWWRCHRRLIADAAVLLVHSDVCHLFHDGRLWAHRPEASARVDRSGVLIYDAGRASRPGDDLRSEAGLRPVEPRFSHAPGSALRVGEGTGARTAERLASLAERPGSPRPPGGRAGGRT